MRALTFKFGVNTKKHKQAKLWQRIATLLTAFVVMGSALAQIAQAAPGDYAWQKAGTNLSGDQSDWRSIASSSDGTKLAAVGDAENPVRFTSTLLMGDRVGNDAAVVQDADAPRVGWPWALSRYSPGTCC